MEERSLLVGLDLCEDCTQLTCYHEKRYEPESIGIRGDEEQYLIPTCLGVMIDSKEWFFGERAVQLSAQKDAVLVGGLLTKAVNPGKTEILGSYFTGTALLEKFLRKVLTMLKTYHPYKTIQRLTVTVEKMEYTLAQAVYTALEPLGLLKDRVQVQGHTAAFLYYTIHQKKELWMNDVALFHIGMDGLHYYRLSINRRTVPMVAAVTEKDFHETFPAELPEEEPETAGTLFEELAQMTIHKQVLSSIYAAGRGFEGNWADGALVGLCVGRKVFKGQNLYAKGACYASKAAVDGKSKDFIFIDDDMTTAGISMFVYKDGRRQEYVLVKPASLWYEVDVQEDLILDDEKELQLQIVDFITKKAEKQVLALDGLEEREPRMTRVRLRVRFTELHACVVSIKDLGFGEYVTSSGRVWEKRIWVE